MYLRAVHAEDDIHALRAFIRANPLGILITALSSPNFPTIQCTHLPWILHLHDETSETELGVLRGHLARANPHSKTLLETVRISSSGSATGTLTDEVSVVFNGPAHAYVTPKFYVATKPATGKVVPTWNYSAVQVYGRMTVFGDADSSSDSSAFLQKQVEDLTTHAERDIVGHSATKPGQAEPWEVRDAPERYIELLKKSIIGVEIRVERLEGKWKMNQEMGKEDREGVVNGFLEQESENGRLMAETIRNRGAMKDAKAAQSAAVAPNL